MIYLVMEIAWSTITHTTTTIKPKSRNFLSNNYMINEIIKTSNLGKRVNKLTIVSSLLLQAIPIAPWATAGSISSIERIEVTCSVIFKRLRPANANNVAWTTPSFSFLKRVWTLPRKFSSTYNEDNPKQIREILKRQNWSQNAETSWEN